jgi:hypothetical protein
MKISRNDPGLANAAAKSGLKRLDEASNKMVARASHATSLKKAFQTIAEARHVIGTPNIRRAIGSRACGQLAFLDVEEGGNGLVIALAKYDARKVPRLSLSRLNIAAPGPHVLARMLQREIGTTDEAAALSRLAPFFNALMMHNFHAEMNDLTPPRGLEVIAGGTGGVLISQVEASEKGGAPWMLAVKTYVSGDVLVEPTLVQLAARNSMAVLIRGAGIEQISEFSDPFARSSSVSD